MKRAGPKGLHAESARAVTGRRCPHSGEGEDFLSCQPGFFYKNCCISGTEFDFPESRKIDPKVGNERSQTRATNGPLTKIGVVWQKSDFWAQNRDFGPKKTFTS